MIERHHPTLPVLRQCALIGLSRSTFYGGPRVESDEVLALMRIIDKQFMETPWYGARQMVRHLRRGGHIVGRKRVRRLMARMGLAAIYQRPKTTVRHPQHRIYPYLLRDMAIARPDQVLRSAMQASPVGQRVRRYHLYPDAEGVPVPRRHHGLVQPAGPGLAVIEHHGGGLLHRGPRRGDGALRQAVYLQHGSGQPVHQPALHRGADGRRGQDLDGRAWPLDGQCVYRTAAALAQI